MKPKAYKKFTTEGALDRVQENCRLKFDDYDRMPFVIGRLLDSNDSTLIGLTTTATNYEHKLGREPDGFLVLYRDANAVIWWDRSGSEDRTKFLRLDASASVNAKIWVF